MKGYKIYLTRSSEVARLIAEALSKEKEKGGLSSVSHGAVNEDSRIPQIYHNASWYCTCAEYRNLDRYTYEIVFA